MYPVSRVSRRLRLNERFLVEVPRLEKDLQPKHLHLFRDVPAYVCQLTLNAEPPYTSQYLPAMTPNCGAQTALESSFLSRPLLEEDLCRLPAKAEDHC